MSFFIKICPKLTYVCIYIIQSTNYSKGMRGLKKIKTKLILGMTICSISAMMLLGIGIFSKGIQLSEEIAKTVLSMNIENKSQEFNTILKNTEDRVHFLAQSIVSEFDATRINDCEYLEEYKEHIGPLLEDFGEPFEEVVSTYFYLNPELTKDLNYCSYRRNNSSSKFLMDTPYTSEDFNPYKEGMEWFYEPIMKGRGFWSDVNTDIHSNTQIISYTYPVQKDQRIIGVVGMNIDFAYFKSIVNDMKFYETGYGSLLNANYDFLVHPKFSMNENLKTVENGSLKIVADTMETSDSSVVKYSFENQKKILGYSKLSNGFILIANAPHDEVTAEINKIFGYMIILLFVSGIVTTIIAILIGNTITKPIHLITDLVEKTSKFDLVYDQNYAALTQSKDEIGVMAKSVIEMRKRLREMIEIISKISQDLLLSAQGIASSSTENATASDEIAHTAEILAQGATSQANQARNGSIKLSELGKEIDNIFNRSDQIQVYMNKTNEAKTNGMLAVKALKEGVEAYNESKAYVLESITNLEEKSSSISEITKAIQSIASQTNLLSLNATIEAARAGESGRGFGIIASEIRKLAEQTAKSSKDIDYTIKEVQCSIESVQKKLQELNMVLEQSNEASNHTISAFNHIDESIKEVIYETELLLKGIANMNENKNQVITAIEEIAAISEESASASQEVLASVEMQSTAIEEIAQDAESLKNLADHLKHLVETFKF